MRERQEVQEMQKRESHKIHKRQEREMLRIRALVHENEHLRAKVESLTLEVQTVRGELGLAKEHIKQLKRGHRFDSFTSSATDSARCVLESLRDQDKDSLSADLELLRVSLPARASLAKVVGPLSRFIHAHPISMLCHENVAPLLAEYTSLYNEYCQYPDCVDDRAALDSALRWGEILKAVDALLPVVPPADIASLSAAQRACVCAVVEYNAVLFEVYQQAEALLASRDALAACLSAAAGCTSGPTSTPALRAQADEMQRQLRFRVAEEADMRQILTELKVLPVVIEDRYDEVEEELDVVDARLARRNVSGRKRATLTAERDALLAEKTRMDEVTVQARQLVLRLQRHMFHPEAAEVLASNPLLHPLEGTRLSPFAKWCLNTPLQSFHPAEFVSVGRTTLLQGVHPVTGVPVVLKGYSLDDSDQVEHARREVSVFDTVRDVHIVPYLGLVLDSGVCYVVIEKYDCNLMDYLRHTPSLDTRRFVARQILLGMAALESHRVVHRDIKPQNVLIKHRGGRVTGVALTDFGISKNSQDYVTTLQRTSSGTMMFIDPESLQTLCFDALSDVYSFGRTMQVLFGDRGDDPMWLHGQDRFSCPSLSSFDVSLINRCLGPKANRLSAYHMAGLGLFATPLTTTGGDVAEAAQGRLQRLLAQVWSEMQRVRGDAEMVPCTVGSLIGHFTPPATPGVTGYCRVQVPDASGDGESPLRAMLSALQTPVLINGEQVPLLEPAGEGEFQLIPSIAACTMMEESMEDRDVDTADILRRHYAALGRFLGFQLLEGPLPHGLLGMAVLASMRGGINTLLSQEGAVSLVFAATFPQQRRTLLRMLETNTPVPFSTIPGAPHAEDRVLSEHNHGAFASLFETSYVRLMMMAGREIHRGYCSLHPEWAEATAALTLDQFLQVSVSMSPFSADQYIAAFAIESDTLSDAFREFVERQLELHSDTLLRLVLVFATGSPMLPQTPMTLVLAPDADRLALPSVHQCTTTITVPDSCLGRLDIALQDSCDAAGVSLGDGARSRQAAVDELNNELNRFRILSERRRTCPSCGVAVEKTEGCNHIECQCGRHWCWTCGFVTTSEAVVYRHMVEKHGGY
ncbi:hypothetical protein KIPB_008494 [Kipferlia bialata]|uniref:mitogen-activated protein kinase kinase n=1 Tax=Kipferlia bialata TaxID=797122 RepID=A0A9K3D0P9_9EUKA|nr:hypothetical protein KIPB_008494 [Kipferlia bialata]|eukprot:g8494.t1